MKTKIDKAKRKAAGHFMLMVFALLSNISYQLSSSVSGTGYERFGEGLTEKERMLVRKMATQIHDQAELCRRLGWRFHGRTHT